MNIGEILRTEREKQGFTYAEIEDKIKIRAKYLEALETEDFQQIPGRAYVFGFLRSYARYLGLDEEEIVSAYKENNLSKAEEKVIEDSLPDDSVQEKKLPKFLTNWWIFGLVFLILLISLFLVSFLLGSPENDNKSQAEKGFAGSLNEMQATDDALEENQVKDIVPEDLELRLEVKENCWVFVKEDGQETLNGTLYPGMKKTFQAKETIWLKLGNAGGVDVFFNNRKLSPLGNTGEVIVKEFNRETI